MRRLLSFVSPETHPLLYVELSPEDFEYGKRCEKNAHEMARKYGVSYLDILGRIDGNRLFRYSSRRTPYMPEVEATADEDKEGLRRIADKYNLPHEFIFKTKRKLRNTPPERLRHGVPATPSAPSVARPRAGPRTIPTAARDNHSRHEANASSSGVRADKNQGSEGRRRRPFTFDLAAAAAAALPAQPWALRSLLSASPPRGDLAGLALLVRLQAERRRAAQPPAAPAAPDSPLRAAADRLGALPLPMLEGCLRRLTAAREAWDAHVAAPAAAAVATAAAAAGEAHLYRLMINIGLWQRRHPLPLVSQVLELYRAYTALFPPLSDGVCEACAGVLLGDRPNRLPPPTQRPNRLHTHQCPCRDGSGIHDDAAAAAGAPSHDRVSELVAARVVDANDGCGRAMRALDGMLESLTPPEWAAIDPRIRCDVLMTFPAESPAAQYAKMREAMGRLAARRALTPAAAAAAAALGNNTGNTSTVSADAASRSGAECGSQLRNTSNHNNNDNNNNSAGSDKQTPAGDASSARRQTPTADPTSVFPRWVSRRARSSNATLDGGDAAAVGTQRAAPDGHHQRAAYDPQRERREAQRASLLATAAAAAAEAAQAEEEKKGKTTTDEQTRSADDGTHSPAFPPSSSSSSGSSRPHALPSSRPLSLYALLRDYAAPCDIPDRFGGCTCACHIYYCRRGDGTRQSGGQQEESGSGSNNDKECDSHSPHSQRALYCYCDHGADDEKETEATATAIPASNNNNNNNIHQRDITGTTNNTANFPRNSVCNANEGEGRDGKDSSAHYPHSNSGNGATANINNSNENINNNNNNNKSKDGGACVWVYSDMAPITHAQMRRLRAAFEAHKKDGVRRLCNDEYD